MKKLILILFTFLMAHGFYSQGNNLQFNQVIFQEFTASAGYQSWVNAGTITVGANKVLKISSLSSNYGSNFQSGPDLKIGSLLAIDGNDRVDLPIWLPAGSYNITMYWYQNASVNVSATISGVEFNIVQ